jgi:hypothetical protein
MTRMAMFTMLVLAVAPEASAQRPPNLNGRWVLRPESVPQRTADSTAPADTAKRDSLRIDSMPPMPPERAGEMGERGETGERRGETPRNRRFGPSPEERLQISRLLAMAQPVSAFTIQQSDTGIVITNDDGFSYTLHPDGRKYQLVTGQDTLAVKAKWDDGSLIAEYEPKSGGKLTEHYFLADSRQFMRLEVTVEHKGLMRPMWQPRIYRKETENP